MSDYRKLIAFGKSSFVISLPKKWLDQHNLKKGSVLMLDATNNELILHPKSDDVSNVDREIRISVDTKDQRRISREVISAYINNFNIIVLYGSELSKKSSEIRATLHNLMALEVMEQTAEKIIAKDFLNIDNIDIHFIMKKMDMIIRSMISDTIECVDESNILSISHRDEDINRLTFMLYRAIRYYISNPLAMNHKNLSSKDLIGLYWQANHMERIADDIKSMASIVPKLTDKEKKVIFDIFKLVEVNFVKTMKALYSNNEDLAHSAAMIKEDIVNSCDVLIDDDDYSHNILRALHQMKSMAISVHNIGRSVYS